MTTWLVLDWSPDFDAVLARAVARHGPGIAGPTAPSCPLARASNRLFLRRHAVGTPAPGECWSWQHHAPLIRHELAVMDLADAKPCGGPDCMVCRSLSPDAAPEERGWSFDTLAILRGALACD